MDSEKREVLQDLGNALREEHGNNYLAIKALEKVEATDAEKIVLHGIRNIGEINEFRKRANFYLVAVDSSKDTRWKRVKESYDNDLKLFEKHDRADKDQGVPYGQQVQKCVENADILFLNNYEYPNQMKMKDELEERFNNYIGLITEEKPRNPSIHETMMTAAASLSLQSHCIKRKVGAVLCDNAGYVVSAGYNEVPIGQKDCLEEYGMCYRDFVRKNFKKELINKMEYCPKCKQKIKVDNNFHCAKCDNGLSEIIPPYKALDKWRSLHAEETTILKTAHFQIENSTLYSTTFPCLQCTKRILYSGIKFVVYVDPYPEEEAVIMLEKGDVKTEKFEGVKAQAYYRLFHPYQEALEKEIAKKLKEL